MKADAKMRSTNRLQNKYEIDQLVNLKVKKVERGSNGIRASPLNGKIKILKTAQHAQRKDHISQREKSIDSRISGGQDD